jgi:hypothetical protein
LKDFFLEIILFKVVIGPICFPMAFSTKLKEHMYLSKENHLLEAGVYTSCTPVKIELVFERNTS